MNEGHIGDSHNIRMLTNINRRYHMNFSTFFRLGAILCISMLVWAPSGFGESMVYDHKIEVKNMDFQWKVDGPDIHIKLKAKTTGWVGIGFNPSKEMKDANFILGYVKQGKPRATDHYGHTLRQHKSDKKLGGKKNVSNIAGKEENGFTEISFTIPLDSGDPKDQAISLDKDTTVMLAYGAGRDSFRSKHQFKTSLKVNLKSGKVAD